MKMGNWSSSGERSSTEKNGICPKITLNVKNIIRPPSLQTTNTPCKKKEYFDSLPKYVLLFFSVENFQTTTLIQKKYRQNCGQKKNFFSEILTPE